MPIAENLPVIALGAGSLCSKKPMVRLGFSFPTSQTKQISRSGAWTTVNRGLPLTCDRLRLSQRLDRYVLHITAGAAPDLGTAPICGPPAPMDLPRRATRPPPSPHHDLEDSINWGPSSVRHAP